MWGAISHKGKITKVSASSVTVSIMPTKDECGKCAISSLCTKAEEIEVPYPDPKQSLVGKDVTVQAPSGLKRKATVLFLIMPMAILIAALAVMLFAGASEGIASLTAISAIIIWYLILYCCRIKISQQAIFTITSIN